MKNKSEFKELQKEWYKKLRAEGFQDIEDRRQNIKQYDRRTIAFDNREELFNFFTLLDHYLTAHPEMDCTERSILELYSEGIYINKIHDRLKIKSWIVKNVIKKYKLLFILGELGCIR